tara:strand:+ start:32 stop:988 length:957 start_codon:yes stop_codon:yes gene_type:complete
MKIIKLLYLKYALSFSICLITSYVIFFIFSLLGNLNEDYFFNTILNLSLLNSLQILTYIPSFIFLITIILFTIFLKSKNEIIIIKSYLNTKKLMMFFLPIVIIFTTIEINKKEMAVFFEDSKLNLVKHSDKKITKILIDNNINFKTYTVFNNIDLNNIVNTEYRKYRIFNDKINLAQFSNNLKIINNSLIAKNYTQYKNDLIEEYSTQKIININLAELIQQSSIVKDISLKKNFDISTKSINLIIFFILLFNYIFLIFSNKKFVNTKETLGYPIFFSVILLIYSFLVFNNSLSIYNQEFEILGSIIIGMLVLRQRSHE